MWARHPTEYKGKTGDIDSINLTGFPIEHEKLGLLVNIVFCVELDIELNQKYF